MKSSIIGAYCFTGGAIIAASFGYLPYFSSDNLMSWLIILPVSPLVGSLVGVAIRWIFAGR